MEKSRSSKVIAVVALVVAVFGLTLGFAAFSNTLIISSSATVKPSQDAFNVEFSSSATAVEALAVSGVPTTGATADAATIQGQKITGLNANFTAPGQSVTYTFYIHNTGEYEAFLKTISFENVEGQSSPKVCVADDPQTTTASLVSAACEDISVALTVDSISATGSMTEISENNSIAAKTGVKTVVVTITYAENGDRADGNFSVAFGDIHLGYSSAN